MDDGWLSWGHHTIKQASAGEEKYRAAPLFSICGMIGQ
jgi:hypothetical protein